MGVRNLSVNVKVAASVYWAAPERALIVGCPRNDKVFSPDYRDIAADSRQ
ncbi:hypothetical protein GCM10022381_16540 [Leifsonia kafniensis]|uniref:Uncharacterized protein n=1 Tax=Leifsonia kafniensis TaxID=475957 RepID=A0ABP7KE66_9MICO